MKLGEKNLLPTYHPHEAKITWVFYEKFLALIPQIQTQFQELNTILESEEIAFSITDELPFQEEIDGVVASFTKTNILKLQKNVDSILKTLPKSSRDPGIFKTHVAPIAVFLLLFTHALPPKQNSVIINLVTKICAIPINDDLSGSKMYSLYQKAAYYLKFQKPLNIENFLGLIDVITRFSCKDDLSLLKEIRLACKTSQLCQDIFLKQKNLQFLGFITTFLQRGIHIFNQKKGDFPNENYFATIYALLVTCNLEFAEMYLLPGISYGLNNSVSSIIAYTHQFSLKNFPEKIPETARQTCLSKIVELCKKNIPLQISLCELAEIFIPKVAPAPGPDNSALLSSILFISNLRSKIYEEKIKSSPKKSLSPEGEQKAKTPSKIKNVTKDLNKTPDQMITQPKESPDLKIQLQKLIKLHSGDQEQIKNLQKRLTRVKLAKSNDETLRKKLKDSLEKKSQDLEIMRDERDKIKINSRDLEEKLSLVENELKTSRSKNQQLSESVTHLQTTLAQKNQELASSRLEQAQLTACVQDLQTQLNRNTEELKTAYQQIDKARTTVSDLQASLFQTQRKAKRISADRDRRQIASENLELRLSQSQTEFKKSHENYLQLLKINSRLEDKLQRYRKKLQRSEDTFFKLNEKKKVCLRLQESEYDRQIKALKETINRQNQQIINLQTAATHNPAFFQLNSNPPLPWPTTRYPLLIRNQ